jgi:glycosyltransferase involved in cell wall biosynthesis
MTLRPQSEEKVLPSISIVVSNFNGGATIEATLISLIEQNYPGLEILVADGGSTENSVEVIRNTRATLRGG